MTKLRNMIQLITGFHAIEERIRRAAEKQNVSGMTVYVSKTGPRVKKILELAKKNSVRCVNSQNRELDDMVRTLPPAAQDHRGIVLSVEGEREEAENKTDFDIWIASQKKSEEAATVIILDSVTDPHNTGAILRSCDQFGVSLAVMPVRNSANDFQDNEIIARSSAGASAYVPVSVVTNLVRSVQQLKDAGFWIYGADAGGKSLENVKFPPKTAIIMGSEGTGIARLLEEQCDEIVSIPTCGRIDSLNVSVAAGVLLYERYRQTV